jgi:hypothetical protein
MLNLFTHYGKNKIGLLWRNQLQLCVWLALGVVEIRPQSNGCVMRLIWDAFLIPLLIRSKYRTAGRVDHDI